jgi:hypothetical protein
MPRRVVVRLSRKPEDATGLGPSLLGVTRPPYADRGRLGWRHGETEVTLASRDESHY